MVERNKVEQTIADAQVCLSKECPNAIHGDLEFWLDVMWRCQREGEIQTLIWRPKD